MKVINGKYYELAGRTKDWLVFRKILTDQDPELVLVKKCRFLHPNGDATYYDISLCKNRKSGSRSRKKREWINVTGVISPDSFTLTVETPASQSSEGNSLARIQSLASVDKVQV